MFAISPLSRLLEKPVETHLMARKHILRYIKGTLVLGILYKKGKDLIAYFDSDYGDDEMTGRVPQVMCSC